MKRGHGTQLGFGLKAFIQTNNFSLLPWSLQLPLPSALPEGLLNQLPVLADKEARIEENLAFVTDINPSLA